MAEEGAEGSVDGEGADVVELSVDGWVLGEEGTEDGSALSGVDTEKDHVGHGRSQGKYGGEQDDAEEDFSHVCF